MKKTRRLTCGNKKKHESHKQAEDAMYSYKRRYAARNVEVYKCGDHWHWGHFGKKGRGR